MALIQCKNCGNEVSDRALVCPHCGNHLIDDENSTIFCEECGTEIPIGVESCPKCGCPVNRTESAHKVELTGVKIKKSLQNKKSIIIIATLAIAIIFITIIGIHVSKQKAEEEAARISEEYSDNFNLAVITMLTGAVKSESVCNLTKLVWYNAIFEKNDRRTDEFTVKMSMKYSDDIFYDFNDALNNLFADSEYISDIDKIESSQTLLIDLMKQLKNPPEEYQEAYQALQKLYDTYLELTNLAVNPTGSLQNYSNNFNTADSNFLKHYNAIKIYVNN